MSGMSDWRDPVEWLPPQPVPMLGADDIHLWRGHLPVGESAHNVVLSYLSDDERARAARYRFAHDRGPYIAARGILRAILAQYLDDRPERLRFRYEPAGKPSCPGREAHPSNSNGSGSNAKAGTYAAGRCMRCALFSL
jgi:hypothetical protein